MGAGPGTAGPPPGYPREYEQEVTLRDGRRVLIRPILPSDAPELGEAIKTADTDTLHRRFLGTPPRVTPALLAHLTAVDYVRRFALVAIDTATGRGVAVARYEPAGEDVAEIAVAVRPAWRQVGLGTALILSLAKAAAERGIHTFSASPATVIGWPACGHALRTSSRHVPLRKGPEGVPIGGRCSAVVIRARQASRFTCESGPLASAAGSCGLV
jgi:GNAT superfamily N-acetyltransferase